MNLKPHSVSCGSYHTVCCTEIGDAFAWGSNEFGQCGTATSLKLQVNYAPQICNFDSYHKPQIKAVSAGSQHTAWLDDIGRVFSAGKNDKGQLGLGTYTDHQTPYYVSRLPEKVCEVACGEMHTLMLTS